MSEVIISLGSNVGDKEKNLSNAIAEIGLISTVTKKSRIYKTAPWGKLDQDDFLNMVISIKSDLEVHDLLHKLLIIEQKLGRLRKEKWGPRTIDLDIIFYDDLIINDNELKVPHPYYMERLFVLEPLMDICPDKRDPRDKSLIIRDLYEKVKV